MCCLSSLKAKRNIGVRNVQARAGTKGLGKVRAWAWDKLLRSKGVCKPTEKQRRSQINPKTWKKV